MRRLSFYKYFAAVLIVLFSANVFSAQLEEENTDAFNLAFNCFDLEAAPSRFKKLEELALKTDSALCKLMLLQEERDVEVRNQLLKFSTDAQNILLDSFSNESVRYAISYQFGLFENEIVKISEEIQNNNYPRLDTTSVEQTLYFTVPGRSQESVINNNFDPACKKVTGDTENEMPFDSCIEALSDAADAFNNYEKSVRRYRAAQNEPKLKYLRSTWDRYLEKARAQTFLDVWVTSAIHDDYYSQRRLVAPHPRQYFLFRPQVVYEINPDTKKGDRNQVGLSLEWFGVNWWDLKVPFGVSAISVYADYEQEKSVGHGLQLTFDNSYSFGWVKRDDSDGVFISFDLLKLWEDKREKLAQYREDPWGWFR